MTGLTDVAPAHLPPPDGVEPPRRVIRRKDLDDLFDTDPDLTGFDVDVSPYVRDAEDTDIRVFWRNPSEAEDEPPRPRRDELCAVSIGTAGAWIKKLSKLPDKGGNLLFQRDPQWRRRDGRDRRVPTRLDAAAGSPAMAGPRAPGRPERPEATDECMRIHRQSEARARTASRLRRIRPAPAALPTDGAAPAPDEGGRLRHLHESEAALTNMTTRCRQRGRTRSCIA